MRRLLAGLALMVLLPLPAWAGPLDGTWRIDFKNTHLDPKPWDQTIKDGRYSCTTCDPKIDIKADGTDQNVPSDGKEPETMAVTVINAQSVRFMHKRAGKLTTERVQTVSADGKTLNAQRTEYPPQGGPVKIALSHSRIGAPPPEAHAVSGVWRVAKLDVQGDNGKLFTLQTTADGVTMSSPMGEGYSAKFDGVAVPARNDPDGGTIAIRKIDANTFEETYSVKGKPTEIHRFTVKGNALTIEATDPKRNTHSTYNAERVTTAKR